MLSKEIKYEFWHFHSLTKIILTQKIRPGDLHRGYRQPIVRQAPTHCQDETLITRSGVSVDCGQIFNSKVPQIRNPKHEIRNKLKIWNNNAQNGLLWPNRPNNSPKPFWYFPFGHSDLFRDSDFEFHSFRQRRFVAYKLQVNPETSKARTTHSGFSSVFQATSARHDNPILCCKTKHNRTFIRFVPNLQPKKQLPSPLTKTMASCSCQMTSELLFMQNPRTEQNFLEL